MNRYLLSIASVSLVLLAVLTSPEASLAGDDSHTKSSRRSEKRVLVFDSKVSLGAVSLVGIDSPEGYHNDEAQLTMTPRKDVCAGVGTQTVEVGSDQYVCFEPNRRLFDNPKLLGNISPGIDVIFIQCTVVDDSEEGRVDRMVQSLDRLRGVKELYCNRSDVSDVGLLRMPIISSLHLFSAFLVPLDGSCLKRLSQQPNMRCLMLWDTRMDQANYKYLPDFHKLLYLDLDDDGITHEGLSHVGKCTTLKDLSLRWNRQIVDADLLCLKSLKNLEKLDLRAAKITDKGIPALLQLTRLRNLTLAETSVTAEGLLALRPLHLQRLTVSDHRYTAAQLKKVEQICAHVSWERPAKAELVAPLDKETLRLFAPISRHRTFAH